MQVITIADYECIENNQSVKRRNDWFIFLTTAGLNIKGYFLLLTIEILGFEEEVEIITNDQRLCDRTENLKYFRNLKFEYLNEAKSEEDIQSL